MAEPDMALIGELMEDMSRNPPAIGARKLLVEHYILVGWLDAALENARELMTLAPGDEDVTGFLKVLSKKPERPKPTSVVPKPVVSRATGSRHAKNFSMPANTNLDGDIETARQDLTTGYAALRAKAKFVLTDMLNLQTLQKTAELPQSQNIVKIQIIAGQHERPASSKSSAPGSARSIARAMRDKASEATGIAVTDLEDTLNWIRFPHGKPSGLDDDTVRDVLVKRVAATQSALPDDLKVHCDLALMHIEHEHLQRNYANTETMLLDPVSEIPRANFYVTEDNYAWDMEELVQAITAANGVMRNPLSSEMFTPGDIKGIVGHALGKGLAALAVEQHEMAKGVRDETVSQMEKLAQVLLEDQSSDTLPSRKAVDEFLAYIATCKPPVTRPI
jgi:hypothetical protein